MAEDLPDVCVVSQPLSAAGASATGGLLHILSVITTVSLLAPSVADNASLPEDVAVLALGERGTGRRIPVQAGRFLLNQLRMCVAVWRREEPLVLFFGATSYLLPILVARLAGKTVILEPRGDVPLTLRLHWERRVPPPVARGLASLVWALERSGFYLATAIVTYTPSMVGQLGLERFGDKVHPSGARFVDTDHFHPRVPFEEREPVVGFLGRLDEEKGIRELARMARLLPEDVTFVFAGDGDLADWLAAELDEDIRSGDVEVTGWVDHEDVPEVLSRFRLLVMPSQPTEGLPTVILESLACGTPVLATPVAGVPDVVVDERTGYHLLERDPVAIADRIVDILEDPALPQVSERGQAVVESTYTLEAATERYRDILHEAGTRPAPRG